MAWNPFSGLLQRRERVSGPPRSGNGASSFHLWWRMPPSAPLVEISCVLEVLEAPAVARLYFWALQVDFTDGRSSVGGGHTGLQWNPRYEGGTAVNWGGYAAQSRGGGVLPGSSSSLPGFPDDPNTLGYPWRPGRPYRFRVHRSPDRPGAWRADVTDVPTGETSLIRELFGGGTYLSAPVVWSEVFADCDAPSVIVRWSDMRGMDAGGSELKPSGVQVSYQSEGAGGCSNTTVTLQDGGVLQVTGVPRMVEQGSFMQL